LKIEQETVLLLRCADGTLPTSTSTYKAMTLAETMSELAAFGSEQTKKTLLRHGAKEPLFGVKVQDLKTIQKKTKHDNTLALQLFDTGNSDAMYLAGLICDPKKMTKEIVQHWAENASWHMLSEYTVAWTASESQFGFELAREWIYAEQEHIASSGWATWGSLVAIKKDSDLDFAELETLLLYVASNIHQAPNRVRYTMNGFVIALGAYVAPLLAKSKEIAQLIGKVEVWMGDTSCQVPPALAYIEKIENRGSVGKKRKTAFC
jgi:3-methyladenine DNA glycosylase AlkD